MVKRLLVLPAAGVGSRLQASVPKPLVLAKGKPLIRYAVDAFPEADLALVIHPDAQTKFETFTHDRNVKFFYQPHPKGMGDAISKTISLWKNYDEILIAWADLVWLTPKLAAEICTAFEQDSQVEMLVPSIQQDPAYIALCCDPNLRIEKVLERREGHGTLMGGLQRADLGLFLLRPTLTELYSTYMDSQDLGIGSATGEKNFLPFMDFLANRKRWARVFDLKAKVGVIGINTPEELSQFERQTL